MEYRIKELQSKVEQYSIDLIRSFKRAHLFFETSLLSHEKELILRNPILLLKRGYSIVRYNNKIISSVDTIQVHDSLEIQTAQGSLETEVKKIIK